LVEGNGRAREHDWGEAERRWHGEGVVPVCVARVPACGGFKRSAEEDQGGEKQ